MRSILLGVALWAISAGSGAAQPAQRPAPVPKPTEVQVTVMVSHVSQNPGPVDPAAAKLERHLSQDFKYKSIRVIQTEHMALGLNQTGSMMLPTGRWLKVKPRKLGQRGVLMLVEIEGTLRTNLRVPNHHQVVIGAQKYQDGKLVVTLEPEYQWTGVGGSPAGAPAAPSPGPNPEKIGLP